MVKAMLVDSSADVVNLYKAYIKRSFDKSVKPVAVLHEASINKFWAAIEKSKPDIIIIDIRFFALSTLRIIREVVLSKPLMKLLITGTYDDYDYLRASMEYGATDYIYKPAKAREFELALGHIVGIFEEAVARKAQDTQILDEYQRDREIFRQRFLTNLTGDVNLELEEIKSSLRYFDINITPPFAVFVLRIDRFQTAIENLEERQKHLLIYRIFWVVNHHLNSQEAGYGFISSFNSVTCIVHGPQNLEELLDLCHRIKDEVAERCDQSVTMGLGRLYDDLTNLRYSAKEAEGALRYRHLLGYNSIIPIDFVEPENHITYKYPAEKEDKLIFAAVVGEYDHSIKLLEEILSALEKAERLPANLLPRIVMKIVIAISRYASELGIDVEGRFREFFNFGEILALKTTDEARKLMQEALWAFSRFIDARNNENSKRMVLAAQERVNQYFFEDLKIGNIAKELGTTGEFLGRAFLQMTSVSFKEYLQTKRIAKAKEILRGEEIVSEEEVAARVGYFDARVFRSVFRRREGMLPMEFRNRQG
ncbi:MAG: helix-turn-helix domain-containing protein [Defluviitaleaceae bacterium]|nr:helix-turn-helix domain-containing protein [Defluviitaleaceae bacterium]